MKVLVLDHWQVFGKIPLDRFIWDHIETQCHAPSQLPMLAPQVSTLMAAITKVINQSFRILCLNPGRQRRSLAISLRDWQLLQQDADFVDECCMQALEAKHMPPGPRHAFSHWVFRQLIAVVILHARRGVELELHYPDELKPTYWYMDHFLSLRGQVIDPI